MEVAIAPLYAEQAVARGLTTEKADLTVAPQIKARMEGIPTPVYR